MTNIREIAETDLAVSLTDPDGFGLPILLVDPDGNETGPYYGQVLYDTSVTSANATDVIQTTVHDPVVVLRRSDLVRVPKQIERNKWLVKIPITPNVEADTKTFVLGHASQDGGSIGFVRLYLTKLAQM